VGKTCFLCVNGLERKAKLDAKGNKKLSLKCALIQVEG